MGQASPRPEREPQAHLQIKEGDRSMLRLSTDDALSLETKTVSIKPNNSDQIVSTPTVMSVIRDL